MALQKRPNCTPDCSCALFRSFCISGVHTPRNRFAPYCRGAPRDLHVYKKLFITVSSLRLCCGVPGLLGRAAYVVFLGILGYGYEGKLQPCLAASTASPGSRKHCDCCRLHRRWIYLLYPIFLYSCLHFFFLLFPFCLLPFPFVVTPILPFLSKPLLIPPSFHLPIPPSSLFSLFSTSNPHPITPAGSLSPEATREV